jgi:hypothetical protein
MQNMALKCQCAVHISSFLGPLTWTGPLDLDRQVDIYSVRLVFYVQTLLNPLLSTCDFMHAPDKKFR